MEPVETARAGPRGDAETGSQNSAILGGLQNSDTAILPEKQRQIDAVRPSPEAVATADEFVLDELYDAFERIRSYAVSGIEAARRGDRDEVRLRLRVQLRDAFRYAVEVHNLLSPRSAEGTQT
jgi:hypothetical protein